MLITVIITWLFLGIINIWRTYHGMLRHWYISNNQSYWEFDKQRGFSAIRLFLLLSPIIILMGAIGLILFELLFDNTWYFTTKKIHQ